LRKTKKPRDQIHRKKVISRGKPPKGYDSWLEFDLHKDKLKGCKHHPEMIGYWIEKKYEPDFVIGDIYIEVKGRFRDRTEATKYIWVLPRLIEQGKELVFVFDNPNLPMPHARKRSDGTKQTHGEWAEKNGFKYYSWKTIPTSWSK